MSDLQLFLLFFCTAVNLSAFILFFIDKRRAIRDRWRIPERTLLLMAFCGGSAGALLAMYLFHHKTRKAKFFVTVPLLLILHILLFFFAFFCHERQ